MEKAVKRDIWNAIATVFIVSFGGGAAFSAAAESFVYIPLGSAGEVAIVDAAQDAVVGKIDALPAVHGLARTPDGRYLIAGSFEERAVGGDVPAKPAGISADEHATHHGATPNDVKKNGAVVSTVSVIDISDRTVVRRIDVPGAVHHVAVSPDGGVAVVTHPNEGTISAIDLISFEVVATLRTGPLPNYAAFSPDGSRVYISNAGNDTLSAVDSERWIIRWNAVVGGSPEHVVISNDGTTLYVNNVDDGTVSVLLIDDRKVVETLPVGMTLHGIDLSDDGRTLFVAVLGEDKLAGIDLTTGTYRSSFLIPAPYHLTAIRKTRKLYVSSADETKIWVIDQRDLKVLGEIPIGGKGHQMVRSAGE